MDEEKREIAERTIEKQAEMTKASFNRALKSPKMEDSDWLPRDVDPQEYNQEEQEE
ncbi:hypothetical protein [Halanaeroarchaeum sulfurireducens]|uniref:hypothetical protein n=1 Tax=Halanaeroarchaeum sulfurireducens TaxID=1604004 RepID=UPI0012B6381C|nr:hypothetical protein [Halanaeroarchaeum sulfurireducens]